MNKIFQQEGDNPSQQTEDNREVNENKSYRDLYVGDDKKYKTDDDAYKALHFSQEYIKQLEEENKKAREELSSREALEDLIDQIQSRVTNVNDESNRGNQSSDEMSHERVNASDEQKVMSRDDIANLVKDALNQEKQQSKFDQNVNEVTRVLEAQWGPGFKALMNTKATELGMSQEALYNLAGTSPNAFLAAVGVSQRTTTNAAPPRSNVNTNFENSRSTGKDWAHYQKMRRENPNLYWSKAVQDEIYRAVESGQLEPR